jgi:hypothetical protein
MACALTSGYSVADCKGGSGGVKEVYIIELANVTAFTETAGVITALTKASAKRFWKYTQLKETSYAKESPNANSQNGTVGYSQEVGLVLNKMQTATRNEILLLAKNYLLMVVKDNNAKYWLYGRQYGMELTGGEIGTGTAMTDRNGYVLTFTGGEVELAIEIEATVAAALETPGT